GLVGAAVVLVGDAVAVAVRPRAPEVLLGPGKVGTAVDVIRHAVQVAVGEQRTAAALGGAGDVGAEIVHVGDPVSVGIGGAADRGGPDRVRSLGRDDGLAAVAALRFRFVRGRLGRRQVRVGAPRIALI